MIQKQKRKQRNDANEITGKEKDMKYTDQRATDLQALYNIPAATVKTWRHRDEIPDYFQGDPVRLIEAEENRILSILSQDWIVIKNLCESAGVAFSPIVDYRRGISRPEWWWFGPVRDWLNERRDDLQGITPVTLREYLHGNRWIFRTRIGNAAGLDGERLGSYIYKGTPDFDHTELRKVIRLLKKSLK